MLSEFSDTWSQKDYIAILDLLGYSDEMKEEDLKELTWMALADQEPEESVALLLKYRLGEHLSDGQIKALSHEMQEDKVSEEYPDVFLQHELFNINQLLFKSFNGKFPNSHAIQIDLGLTIKPVTENIIAKRFNELIIKSLLPALGDHSVIGRLYEDELKSGRIFPDADAIIWQKNVTKENENTYNIQLRSSEYWLHDLPNHAEYNTSFELIEPEVGH